MRERTRKPHTLYLSTSFTALVTTGKRRSKFLNFFLSFFFFFAFMMVSKRPLPNLFKNGKVLDPVLYK